jgi:hypothetical protein
MKGSRQKTVTGMGGCWTRVPVFALCSALVLSACSTVPRAGSPSESSQGEFIVLDGSAEGLKEGINPGPAFLIQKGAQAWKAQSFEESGDFIKAAYHAGKDLGWTWQPGSKVNLICHALRAYHLAGAVAKQKALAKWFLSEMDSYDSLLLSREDRVLIYWSTSDEQSPAFEEEIPRALRITTFVR